MYSGNANDCSGWNASTNNDNKQNEDIEMSDFDTIPKPLDIDMPDFDATHDDTDIDMTDAAANDLPPGWYSPKPDFLLNPPPSKPWPTNRNYRSQIDDEQEIGGALMAAAFLVRKGKKRDLVKQFRVLDGRAPGKRFGGSRSREQENVEVGTALFTAGVMVVRGVWPGGVKALKPVVKGNEVFEVSGEYGVGHVLMEGREAERAGRVRFAEQVEVRYISRR